MHLRILHCLRLRWLWFLAPFWAAVFLKQVLLRSRVPDQILSSCNRNREGCDIAQLIHGNPWQLWWIKRSLEVQGFEDQLHACGACGWDILFVDCLVSWSLLVSRHGRSQQAPFLCDACEEACVSIQAQAGFCPMLGSEQMALNHEPGARRCFFEPT